MNFEPLIGSVPSALVAISALIYAWRKDKGSADERDRDRVSARAEREQERTEKAQVDRYERWREPQRDAGAEYLAAVVEINMLALRMAIRHMDAEVLKQWRARQGDRDINRFRLEISGSDSVVQALDAVERESFNLTQTAGAIRNRRRTSPLEANLLSESDDTTTVKEAWKPVDAAAGELMKIIREELHAGPGPVVHQVASVTTVESFTEGAVTVKPDDGGSGSAQSPQEESTPKTESEKS